jgi:hypothetical protein
MKSGGMAGGIASALSSQISKINTSQISDNVSTSTKVEIIDETLIPEEYFNIKFEKTVDKVSLKEVLKSQDVPGVKLSLGYNLNIQ